MRGLVLFFTVVTLAAAGFAGCGKKGGNVAATPGTPAVVAVGSCLPGQVYNGSYGCLDRGACPEGQGWVPTLARCESGTTVTYDQIYGANASLRWGIALTNINRPVFEELMRAYGGFCGQYTWNFGTYNCSTYSKAGYVIVQSVNSTAAELNVTIGAGASAPYSTYNYWSAWTNLNAFPMQFRATMGLINNSQGFEFRAGSMAGVNTWNAINSNQLVGYVNSGTLASNVLNIELYYMGQPLATAAAERY